MSASAVRPPYANDPMIRGFFDRMKTLGEPTTIDRKWLSSYGVGGSQPVAVLGLLKWLKVIDAAGASTGVWNDLRTNREETLERLTRESYAPIFDAVEIETADKEVVTGAFIHEYKSGDAAKPVRAFLTLCELSGISSPALSSPRTGGASSAIKATPATTKAKTTAKTLDGSASTRRTTAVTPPAVGNGSSPRVDVVLSIELPATMAIEDVDARVRAVLEVVRKANDS